MRGPTRSSPWWLLSLAVQTAFSTPPALAQEQKSDKAGTPAPQATEHIEVSGSASAGAREISVAAKVVVTRSEIGKYGDTSLADVLRRIPGITISGAPGQQAEIRFRGLGEGYVNILIDGERAPVGFSLDSLSPEVIERIEVLRVPTAEHGAEAIAGTINIVLARTPTQRDAQLTARASVEHDRPAGSLAGTVGAKTGWGSYSATATALRESHDLPSSIQDIGTDAADDTDLDIVTRQREKKDIDTFTLVPRLTWNVTPDTSLVSDSFLRYRSAEGSDEERAATISGSPPRYVNNIFTFRQDTTSARSDLELRQTLPNEGTFEVKLGGTFNETQLDAVFDGFDEHNAFVLHRTVAASTIDRGTTASGKYRVAFLDTHYMTAGWEGQASFRSEERVQHDITFTDLPPQNLDERYEARVRRFALYGQDEWDIDAGRSLYLGLRWEGIDTRTLGNVIETAGNRSSVWSPILQCLIRIPNTRHQIRAAISRTYKAPSTADLVPRRFMATNNSPVNPDTEGNPQLLPELAAGVDAAYEIYFGRSSLVSVGGYWRRIDDVILHELVNDDGEWILRPANQGRADAKGIELEAKVDLAEIWDSAPAVHVRASISRNWSNVLAIEGPDNRLDRQTPVSANLGLDYTLPKRPFTVGANFNFQSGGTVRVAANRKSYASATRVLDVYGLWKFSPTSQMRLSFANVLAQTSVTSASYFDGTTTLRRETSTPTWAVVRLEVEKKF